jgi:hypothetical protein
VLEVRYVPWPFLINRPIDPSDNVLMDILYRRLDNAFGANPDFFLMWMERDHGVDTWYKIVQDKQEEMHKEIESLSKNTALRNALIFSLVIGIFGGVLGVIFAHVYLRRFSRNFWKHCEHMRRYKRTKTAVR